LGVDEVRRLRRGVVRGEVLEMKGWKEGGRYFNRDGELGQRTFDLLPDQNDLTNFKIGREV